MIPEIEKKLSGFFESKNTLRYEEGEIIYRAGEKIVNVSFIQSGHIRIYRALDNGQEVTISFFSPMFILSYLYSKYGKESPYYFQAISAVKLWKAPFEEVEDFLEKNEELRKRVMNYIFEAFEILLENITTSLAGGAQSKVSSAIHFLAVKHSTRIDDEVKLDFNTTHRFISTMCGLSRETVSKEIKKLENKGLINQLKDTIIVDDLRGLEEFIQK